MRSTFFPSCQFKKRKYPTVEELRTIFYQAYNGLTIPIVLCDGLEIIATNLAGEFLFKTTSEDDEPILLSEIITDTQQITRLFDAISISIIHQSKEYELSAKPWGEYPRFRLLEWHDHTIARNLTTQLHSAKNHDPSTGAILPGAFFRKLTQYPPAHF